MYKIENIFENTISKTELNLAIENIIETENKFNDLISREESFDSICEFFEGFNNCENLFDYNEKWFVGTHP